jgi:dephospho-CoA kinase
MVHVGLTGGIGSGKSLVARIFRTLGAPVFEADAEAKRLMNDDPDLRSAITQRFGEPIYKNEKLDRKALASIVFKDPSALADLNALVHPAVRRAFSKWASIQKAPYVIMEAALLTETGGRDRFDRIIVVSAPEELRVKRVTQRDGVNEQAVYDRMRNQATEEQRLKIADFVIVNDEKVLVIPQVLKIHQELSALPA